MKLLPEDKRLIWNLWVRGWSAREIANYMNGGVYAPPRNVSTIYRYIGQKFERAN
jgi:hypothetical protein